MLNPNPKIKLLNKYAIGNFIYLLLFTQVAVQCRIFIMFLYGIAALWWLFSFTG